MISDSMAAAESATKSPGRRRTSRPLPPVPSHLAADSLLTAKEAAAYRRQGLSTFWRDVRNGSVPQPVRVSPKGPRWRLRDLTAALESAT